MTDNTDEVYISNISTIHHQVVHKVVPSSSTSTAASLTTSFFGHGNDKYLPVFIKVFLRLLTLENDISEAETFPSNFRDMLRNTVRNTVHTLATFWFQLLKLLPHMCNSVANLSSTLSQLRWCLSKPNVLTNTLFIFLYAGPFWLIFSLDLVWAWCVVLLLATLGKWFHFSRWQCLIKGLLPVTSGGKSNENLKHWSRNLKQLQRSLFKSNCK